MSPREISTRRRQAQKYISQDEESDDEEEDDDEEERSVKMKTRRGSDDALEKHNDEEADENKDTANREEGGRMLLRKGRKRAEVAEEEMEDGEQPKRSHKRMEVEPMPEAEVISIWQFCLHIENFITLRHFKVFNIKKFETVKNGTCNAVFEYSNSYQ